MFLKKNNFEQLESNLDKNHSHFILVKSENDLIDACINFKNKINFKLKQIENCKLKTKINWNWFNFKFLKILTYSPIHYNYYKW